MQPMRDDAFNYENTNSESFSLLLDYDYQPNRPDQARPNQAKPGQARPSIHRESRALLRGIEVILYMLYTSVFVLTISLPSPASLPPFVRRPPPLLRHNERHSVGNETLWTLSEGGKSDWEIYEVIGRTRVSLFHRYHK